MDLCRPQLDYLIFIHFTIFKSANLDRNFVLLISLHRLPRHTRAIDVLYYIFLQRQTILARRFVSNPILVSTQCIIPPNISRHQHQHQKWYNFILQPSNHCMFAYSIFRIPYPPITSSFREPFDHTWEHRQGHSSYPCKIST